MPNKRHVVWFPAAVGSYLVKDRAPQIIGLTRGKTLQTADTTLENVHKILNSL